MGMGDACSIMTLHPVRFTPGTEADKTPQANDAKCGFSCHKSMKTKDYVFTEYGKR